MKWYKPIPNLLTLGNLLFGCIAAVYAFKLQFDLVALCIGIALVLDFLDGTVARLLSVQSAIGKDLDSLADMVTFGAVPALSLFNYWNSNLNTSMDDRLVFVVFLIPLFSAYRLAKFNNSEQSSEYFTGLATPALAIACYTIPLAADYSIPVYNVLNAPAFILVFPLLGGLALISKVKFLSYKLGGKHAAINRARWASIPVFIALIAFFKFFGLFLCLLMYIGISLTIQNQFKRI